MHRRPANSPNDYIIAGILSSFRRKRGIVVFLFCDFAASFVNATIATGGAALVLYAIAGRYDLVPAVNLPTIAFGALAVAAGLLFAVVIKSLGWTHSFRLFSEDVGAPARPKLAAFFDALVCTSVSLTCRTAALLVLPTGLIAIFLWWSIARPTSSAAIAGTATLFAVVLTASVAISLFLGLFGTQLSAVRFVSQMDWRETIAATFRHTASNGVTVYKIFVSTLLLIFPALIFLYLTAFVQSLVTIWPQISSLSSAMSSVGNFLLTASIAAAAFYFQAASFWFYATATELIDTVPARASGRRRRTISFDTLAPKQQPNVFQASSILKNGEHSHE